MLRPAALVGALFVACSVAGASSGSPAVPVVNGRLAFDKRSDLYTIRPNGSGLVHLTRGSGSDARPDWSRDGRWIAFDRTERGDKVTSVYVVGEAGGRPRLLVRGARSPKWSPSGRRLAVVRSGVRCSRSCPSARDLWTVAFAGGRPRLALAGAWSGDWSPSGHALAAMRKDGIWIISNGSGTVRLLSSVSGGVGTRADWSPDGSRLLLVNSNGLFTVSTLDGSIATLRGPPAPPTSDAPSWCNARLSNPIWSPDGRWIAYEERGCDEAGRHSRIEIIDPEGRYRYTISNDQYPWAIHGDGQSMAVWSPDSLSLAFIEDRSLSGESFLTTSRLLATATRSDFKFDYRELVADVWSAPAWQRLPRPRP